MRSDEDTALLMAHPLQVARLPRNRPTAFDLRPDAAAVTALTALLGVSQLRKLRFEGTVAPCGDTAGGWVLTGQLGATLVQPCSVTLAPVTTRIEEKVQRRYLPDLALPDAPEAQLPEDVDAEPLQAVIDPAAVMVEALALAVPPFPRAADADLGAVAVAPPGVDPLRDEDLRPLAGLAALRDRLRDT